MFKKILLALAVAVGGLACQGASAAFVGAPAMVSAPAPALVQEAQLKIQQVPTAEADKYRRYQEQKRAYQGQYAPRRDYAPPRGYGPRGYGPRGYGPPGYYGRRDWERRRHWERRRYDDGYDRYYRY